MIVCVLTFYSALFFFKQKTAYEMRISDWSSDVCSSDLGALTYALKANTDNGLVEFVRDAASALDLGIFSMENGIKQFEGDSADTKNALFNWGLGAVFWLIVGRLADKFIRP